MIARLRQRRRRNAARPVVRPVTRTVPALVAFERLADETTSTEVILADYLAQVGA